MSVSCSFVQHDQSHLEVQLGKNLFFTYLIQIILYQ